MKIFEILGLKLRGRSQMTSCKISPIFTPLLPPLRHYYLQLHPPQNKKWRHLGLTPLRNFTIFYAYNYIYILVVSTIINAMNLKMNLGETTYDCRSSSEHVIDTSSSFCSSSSWSYNLQIRAPPLHRRQLIQSQNYKAMIHWLLIFTVLSPDT